MTEQQNSGHASGAPVTVSIYLDSLTAENLNKLVLARSHSKKITNRSQVIEDLINRAARKELKA